MGDIKESVNLMEQNIEYIKLLTRMEIAQDYLSNDKYPELKMLCLILGLYYKEKE